MGSSPQRIDGSAQLVSEVLLVAAVIFAPLAFGAVHLWALVVMAALTIGSAAAASLGRPMRMPAIFWAAVALCVYVQLQALTLPHALLALLSPRAAELVTEAAGAPIAHALSLDPSSTERELLRLLAATAGLYAAARIAAESSGARRLGRVICLLAVAQCLLIAFHKIIATGDVYGFMSPTAGTFVLGSFGNSNFLAGYLTLGVAPLIAFGLRRAAGGLRMAWYLAAALTSLLLILTASRSGVIGLCAGLAVFAFLCRSELRWESLPLLGAFAAALVLGGLGIAMTDPTRLAKFTALLHPASLATTDLKVRSWHDVPHLIGDFWRTGVGRGAFEEVFPMYKHLPERITFSHVECVALQLPADFGVIVGGAVMIFWIFALGQAARTHYPPQRESQLLRLAAVSSLAGLSIHELGDFSLDAAGAVGLTAAVLWGIAAPARPRRSAGDAGSWRALGSKGLALTLSSLTIAAGVHAGLSAVRGDLPHDVAAVTRAMRPAPPPAPTPTPGQTPPPTTGSPPGRAFDHAAVPPSDRPVVADAEPVLRIAMARHPVEPWFPYEAGIDHLRKRQPGRALRDFNRALLLDPTAWRPHQALGEALYALGLRDQALLEYRLAYQGSGGEDDVLQALYTHPSLTAGTGLLRFTGDAAISPGFSASVASALERRRQDLDAARVAEALLAAVPTDDTALRVLARVDLRAGKLAEGIALAARLPPRDPEAIVLRVQGLDGLGRRAEADALLSTAIGGGGLRAPDAEPPTTALPLGMALLFAQRSLAADRADDALAALQRVSPDGLGTEDLAQLQMLMSRALERKGRLREAVQVAGDAVRLDPSAAHRFELAQRQERAGLLREAIFSYRSLLREPSVAADVKTRLDRLNVAADTAGSGITGGAARERELPEALQNSLKVEGEEPAAVDAGEAPAEE